MGQIWPFSNSSKKDLITPYEVDKNTGDIKIEINLILYKYKDPQKIEIGKNEKYIPISIGINIGASKSLYSFYKVENGKLVSHVLLINENSSRSIPSIVCYTKSHRLFGNNTLTSLKQNLEYSYRNLGRLIDFQNNDFYKKELNYGFLLNQDINNYKFKSQGPNGEYEVKSQDLIADYLYLINDYFFNKNDIEYDYVSLSVPDYYNTCQRQKLYLICETLGMKNVKLYNETSAITMYYGYTKYDDLFAESEKEKNILFIDAGHSKTTFFISKFSKTEFSVLDVYFDKHLGGRNFDERLVEYCFNEFKKQNDLGEDYVLNPKTKHKLLEVIQTARVKLTVNTEINISIDVFDQELDKDLIMVLTRDKFEELINDYLEDFRKHLQTIIKNYETKGITIEFVELAGQLMLTPCIQDILQQNNLKISKCMLIDECASVGASILRFFEMNKDYFPKKALKTFNHYYSIKCELNHNNIQPINDNNNLIPFENNECKIRVDINECQDFADLKVFFEDKLMKKDEFWFGCKINLKEIYNNIKSPEEKEIRKNYLIIIKNLEKIINGNIISIKKQNTVVLDDAIPGLMMEEKEKEQFKTDLQNYLDKKKEEDDNYHKFIDKKLMISKAINSIKYISKYYKDLKNETKELTKLDKELRKIEDIKEFDKIEDDVNNIFLKHEDNIIKSLKSAIEKVTDDGNDWKKEIEEKIQNTEKKEEKICDRIEEIRSIYEVDEIRDYL